MPLIVFILIALFCLLMLGFACACLSEEVARALERALQSPSAFAVAGASAAILLTVGRRSLLLVATGTHRTRGSPELLQRFLF